MLRRLAGDDRPSTRSGTATRAGGPSPTRHSQTASQRHLSGTPPVPCSPPLAARAGRRRRWTRRYPRRGAGRGRATVEDAYAYAKFARVVLGTNDVDFRARACSDEGDGIPGPPGRRRRDAGGLRRPRARTRRPPGRTRAGGRIADDLPAPAQGGPRRDDEGALDRALVSRG